MKTLGLCSDHAGYELKEFVKQILDSKGLAYKDFGTDSKVVIIPTTPIRLPKL